MKKTSIPSLREAAMQRNKEFITLHKYVTSSGDRGSKFLKQTLEEYGWDVDDFLKEVDKWALTH